MSVYFLKLLEPFGTCLKNAGEFGFGFGIEVEFELNLNQIGRFLKKDQNDRFLKCSKNVDEISRLSNRYCEFLRCADISHETCFRLEHTEKDKNVSDKSTTSSESKKFYKII